MPRTTNLKAKVYAVAVEVHCPICKEPIPASDGSLMHADVPQKVTCNDCGRTFSVSKKISELW